MASSASERRRVQALIQQAGVAMLTTIDEHAAPIGRPMLPLFLDNDPCIYFLTHQNSRKGSQIMARPQVGLTMSSTGCYLVVAGTTATLRDPELDPCRAGRQGSRNAPRSRNAHEDDYGFVKQGSGNARDRRNRPDCCRWANRFVGYGCGGGAGEGGVGCGGVGSGLGVGFVTSVSLSVSACNDRMIYGSQISRSVDP